MNVAEAQALFAKHQIKFVLAQFVDIHGAAKAKAVPVEHLDMVLTDGAGFAGFALWGFGMGPDGPDYMAVGDLSTLTPIPWMPGYARLVCNGTVKGKPYPYCSRVTLQRQLARLAERRHDAVHGHRARVHVVRPRRRRKARALRRHRHLDKPCYDYKGLSRTSAVLDDITLRLRSVGIDVYQIDHEDANGQFEVNFTYADALEVRRQLHVRENGGQRDRAQARHDRHVHAQAVLQPHRQRRAFPHLAGQRQARRTCSRTTADKRGLALSTMAYQFLGGVLAHARALAAVCAPTVNSYKRLVVGRALSGATWAPAYVAYGDNNRTACVRIPGGRLELRLPDSGCNPYLALAAVVAAGLDGIDRKLDPGEPTNLNMYELSRRATAREEDRPAAAEPARGHRRAGKRRSGEGGLGRGARRRVHHAQAHGMDRIRAPCLRLGNAALPGVLLMCGIVGLLLKKPELRERLGELMAPMLVGMTSRGPDSAGVAIFGDASAGQLRTSCRCSGAKARPTGSGCRPELARGVRWQASLSQVQEPASMPC